MPLPLEDFDRLHPARGDIFVERDEQPERYADRIWVPESYRTKVQSTAATVRAVGAGVPLLVPGDRVLIAAGVARRIEFGERNERTLFVCYYAEVYGLLLDDAKRIEDLGEAIGGRFPFVSPRAVHAVRGVADEGRTHGG